jgi:hypothetical protein
MATGVTPADAQSSCAGQSHRPRSVHGMRCRLTAAGTSHLEGLWPRSAVAPTALQPRIARPGVPGSRQSGGGRGANPLRAGNTWSDSPARRAAPRLTTCCAHADISHSGTLPRCRDAPETRAPTPGGLRQCVACHTTRLQSAPPQAQVHGPARKAPWRSQPAHHPR